MDPISHDLRLEKEARVRISLEENEVLIITAMIHEDVEKLPRVHNKAKF